MAVGYPLTDKLLSPRRFYDLTPPRDPQTLGEYGGADKLLDFTQNTVKPFIVNEVFSGSTRSMGTRWGVSLLCIRSTLSPRYSTASLPPVLQYSTTTTSSLSTRKSSWRVGTLETIALS